MSDVQPTMRDFLLSPAIDAPARLTIRQVMDYVCSKYGLTMEELRGQQRAQRVSRPRQEAFWLCSKFCEASLPQIGKAFGDRDHTTVMHGRDQHEKRMKAELELLGEG